MSWIGEILPSEARWIHSEIQQKYCKSIPTYNYAPMKTINRYKRKSIRLREYDYSTPGEYFVTICAHEHICIFGNIVDEEMRLSEIGIIAEQCWNKLPVHFKNVILDEYVMMPNHLHGIIVLNDHCRDVQLNVPTRLSPKNIHCRLLSEHSRQL
jgi:hypothetical protein